MVFFKNTSNLTNRFPGHLFIKSREIKKFTFKNAIDLISFVYICSNCNKSICMVPETDNYNKLKSFFNDEYISLKAYTKSRIDHAADSDAEDIIQEVALKIFSRNDDLTPISNIAGFVYNAIKNKIIDIMRTKKRESALEDEMENRLLAFTELFYGMSDNTYSDNMKIELKRAIFNLKPLYKDIVIAIDFEGYTYKEVARESGIPEGTLMSRRHRALSILHKELENKKDSIN